MELVQGHATNRRGDREGIRAGRGWWMEDTIEVVVVRHNGNKINCLVENCEFTIISLPGEAVMLKRTQQD